MGGTIRLALHGALSKLHLRPRLKLSEPGGGFFTPAAPQSEITHGRRYRAAARAYLKISQRLRRKIERRSSIGAKTESVAQGGTMVGKHGDKTDRSLASLV
jgi:hypothetical protein